MENIEINKSIAERYPQLSKEVKVELTKRFNLLDGRLAVYQTKRSQQRDPRVVVNKERKLVDTMMGQTCLEDKYIFNDPFQNNPVLIKNVTGVEYVEGKDDKDDMKQIEKVEYAEFDESGKMVIDPRQNLGQFVFMELHKQNETGLYPWTKRKIFIRKDDYASKGVIKDLETNTYMKREAMRAIDEAEMSLEEMVNIIKEAREATFNPNKYETIENAELELIEIATIMPAVILKHIGRKIRKPVEKYADIYVVAQALNYKQINIDTQKKVALFTDGSTTSAEAIVEGVDNDNPKRYIIQKLVLPAENKTEEAKRKKLIDRIKSELNRKGLI